MDGTEALFAHLEELVARLDGMRAEGERLARGKAARAADAALRYLDGQRNEYSRIEAQMDAAADAVARLSLGNSLAVRAGALRQAERDAAAALAEGGFADADAVRAALMPVSELEALQAEVDAYREDYAATLAAAQAAAPEGE